MESIRFYGVEILYDSNVLTPRLETESLVKFGIQNYIQDADVILDIGTGSGAIIASITHSLLLKKRDELKNGTIQCIGIDISDKALQVASANIQKLGLPVSLLHGDLLTELLSPIAFMDKSIVCFANLPYIARGEQIGDDVAIEDPELALYGDGIDGFGTIERFLNQAYELSRLQKTCVCLLEFGHLQKELFTSWCKVNTVASYGTFEDLVGIERFGYCIFK